MSYYFEEVDSTQWDSELSQSPYASPFHGYGWNNMVAEQLSSDFRGYEVSRDDDKWLVPVYKSEETIKSSFIGYGGPVAIQEVTDGNSELRTSIEILKQLKAILGAKAISGTLYPASFWPSSENSEIEHSVTTVTPINFTIEHIFHNVISGNCRTAIRKAERSDVSVRELDPKEDTTFGLAVKLLQETQLKVGSHYTTSPELLNAINNLDEDNISGHTYVAELEGQPIAMSTVIANQREAFNIFNGWDRSHAQYCANQALHWNNIQKATERGNIFYNMGESHTPEILASKLRWGGSPVIVPRIAV